MSKRLFEKIAIISIGLLILGGVSYALNLSRVKTWSNSEVLTASALNAEFDNILDHTVSNNDLADGDWGDVSVSANSVTLDADVVDATALKDTNTPADEDIFTYEATGTTGEWHTLAELGILTTAAGATIELDNLGTVAINTSLISDTNNTDDLGSDAKEWKDIWIDGTAYLDTVDIDAGSVTGITDLLMADGGTGASLTNDPGGILYCGASVLAVLANDAGSAKFLRCGATGAPAWDTVNMASEVNGTLPVGNGGTGATAAANAANGVAVLGADGYLANDLVDTTALKTATSEVSRAPTAYTNAAVTGGAYCFWPQIKVSSATNDGYVQCWRLQGSEQATTSYATYVSIYAGSNTWYTQFTYITASGLDYWIWLKVDRVSGDILSASAAPDHVSYGNGGDPDKVPHPFISYDETKHEIILLDKETCNTIKEESKLTGKSILTLVNEEYKPDMSKPEKYKPLHSGKFLGEAPVMIEAIPDYIKVRKLVKLTLQDKQDREIKHQQIETERLQLEQLKKAKVNQLKEKLGLSDEEYNLLKGE